jgi:uncharacterized membrane protein
MMFEWFILARVLHVLAVVIWIGGVAMVTTVVFPIMRLVDSGKQMGGLFEQIEKRFRPQAQIAWIIVGLSGLYMVHALDGWARFTTVRYWWMDAMVGLWVIFGLALFVLEPLIVRSVLKNTLVGQSAKAVSRIEVMHWLLLVLSLLVVGAAVGGAHGWG